MAYEEVTIGACRLIRGDCQSILPSLNDVGAIVTSPPFNAGRAYELTSWDTLEEFFRFCRQWITLAAKTLRAGGWFFCEVQDMHLSPEHPHAKSGQKEQSCMNTHTVLSEAMQDAGLLFKATVIWDRGRWGGDASRLLCAPGSPAILVQHSFCLFARQAGGYKGAYEFTELSGREKSLWCRSIWNHIRPESIPGHPAPMPLVMARGVLQGWSLPPDLILDPFMGSGTTGVACVQLGRSFIGVEMEPSYFDLACQRIEQAYAQPDFFVMPAPQQPKQLTLKELSA